MSDGSMLRLAAHVQLVWKGTRHHGTAMKCSCFMQVAFTRGQAPVTRAAAEDVSRAAAWALLEPCDQPRQLQVHFEV